MASHLRSFVYLLVMLMATASPKAQLSIDKETHRALAKVKARLILENDGEEPTYSQVIRYLVEHFQRNPQAAKLPLTATGRLGRGQAS